MWDEQQEAADRKEQERGREGNAGRGQRVIKHPLYRPFNSAQAQEYLGTQSRGDVVIRPSSKGLDHLAVTWKVSDNIYQHIDVLELDKENEFSVGRTLKVGGKYTYTDLDELIVLHVKAMAKKVEEMMGDERFQNGSKAQTGKSCDLILSSNTNNKQSNGLLRTPRPTPSAACTPFASTQSTQATLPAASRPGARRHFRRGRSRSSPTRLSCRRMRTRTCGR